MEHAIRRFSTTLFAWAALASAALAAPAPAPQTPPDVLVRETSEEVIAVIRKTTDPATLLELAESKVAPHFDFQRMTRLAVGRSWQQATPEQQRRLEKEFRDLLVRTYTNAVAAGAGKHSDASIKYKPMQRQEGDEAVVRTQAVESGKPPVAIDYAMTRTPDGWKVYDVTVDNVSLVTNYRSAFNSTIGQSGIDGLIAELEQKNRKNRGSGGSAARPQ